ncbi:MAG: acyltransferase [Spirochaetales bacterium]|jgi:hypothetical protein|nr:acyltransferase [Spirochaetales bacterium]
METGISANRENYIDNIRSITVLIVIVYHVVYLFNSAGVVKSIGPVGIQAFDSLCYFVYPWLMAIMFLLAGISAKYALQHRTGKQFLKERVQKLLAPLVGGIFLLAWINGWVSSQYVDMFGNDYVPPFIKYLIFCLFIGPLWFNLELFFVSLILLLVRKIDKRERFSQFIGRSNIFILCLLALPFWGASFLLNAPLITTFRNGIYLFVFLTGYYIFSNKKIIQVLIKYRYALLIAGILLGIVETYYFYGQNYAADACLQHPLTNLYAWIMMLAFLGFSKKHFDFTNAFLQYTKNRSFYWYLCHYPIMAFTAYYITTFFKLPMIYNYIVVLIVSSVGTLLFSEIICKVPVLRYWLFGIKKKSAIFKSQSHLYL